MKVFVFNFYERKKKGWSNEAIIYLRIYYNLQDKSEEELKGEPNLFNNNALQANIAWHELFIGNDRSQVEQ